jgi:SNF2 family DNA or RNA helicase
MGKYLEFERDEVLQLAAGEITAVNAAALTNKLLQFANGAVYDELRNWHYQHDEKLDRLLEIIESAAGHPVLVFYSFQHDLVRIQARLQAEKIECRRLKTDKDVTDWNARKIPVMIAHPASAGHGLNLQAGGNIIIWYGLPWALELYQQGNARLHRQGVTKPVIIHHLLAGGTMDYAVYEALQGKADSQQALLTAVKARVARYQKLQNIK